MKRPGLVAACLLCVLAVTGNVLAHEVRPAYLELREEAEGIYDLEGARLD